MTQLLLTRGAASPSLTIYHDFYQAASTWRTLERSAPGYIFQTYDWLLAWHQTIGTALAVEPFIAVATDGQNQVGALFPFGIRRRIGCRILEFLGAVVTDYNAPLLGPRLLGSPQAIADVWDRIVTLARPDVVRLRQMPERLPGNLPNPMTMVGRTRHVTDAHYTTLPATFGAFTLGRKAKYFHETRRKRRQLGDLGEVHFMVLDKPDDIARTLNLSLAQRSRKYGSCYVDPAIMPAFGEFYRKVALTPSRSGRSVVGSLCVDDITVATGYGMLREGRFYGLMLGHEAGKWANLSPGRCFLWELVRWCIDEGVEIFDLTIGDEDYKRYWCDRQMKMFESQYPLTARGAAFLAAQWLNDWRRRSR